MRSHMIAFGGAALDLSAGLVTVPFIPDPLIRASSNIMQLSDDWMMLWGFAGGVGLARLRLSSASSRLRGFPNLQPFNASVLGGDNPSFFDYREYPLQLYNGENVTIQGTNGVANDVIVLLSLARGTPDFNVNSRGLRLIRFTASLTSVAFTWGPEANIVLDDDIEAGRYNVYGMAYEEADAIAARLVFKDQVERPGCIANQSLTTRPAEVAYGGQGLWGSFDSITPPFIQSMHVASAAQSLIGYLLVGKA